MNKQKPKIFLSYAREDMGMAKQLYNDLKRYGLDVWLDTESLLPGDPWKDRIQDAIENSNYFIALLSTKSVNKKGFVQKELKTALEVLNLFPSSERFILPVRLDNCEICERKLKEHHWVDLFPLSEYQIGLKKIIQVIYPEAFLLRTEATEIESGEASQIIKEKDFYDKYKNPQGKGITHQYKLKVINEEEIISDETTGLMWQRSGSTEDVIIEDAKDWIKKLNQKGFAAFNDWRLPTIEEAMSLLEPEKIKGLNINPMFDSKQNWIWTIDKVKNKQETWGVDFDDSGCSHFPYHNSKSGYVRAVRSEQSSKE